MKKLFIVFLVCSIIGLPIVIGSLTEGLVSYYSFDNNCTGDDYGSYTLTAGGTPTNTDTNCANGNCCVFDGSDYMYSTSIISGALADDNVGSICFYVNYDAVDAGGTTIGIGDFSGTSDFLIMQQQGGGNGTIDFYINDAGTKDWGDATANILTPDYMHFMCVVQDASSVKIYKNAQDITSLETTTDTTTWINDLSNADMFCVGCLPYSNAYQFKMSAGEIDEITVYSVALNNTAISLLYNYSGDPTYTANVSDTTSPSITNVNQDPSNLTVLNALLEGVYFNATITDSSGLNYSTIKLNVSYFNISQYINGVDVFNSTELIPYTNYSGSVFNWYDFEENKYLGYTMNLPEEDFEQGTLLNDTLTSNNQLIKMKFENVSTDTDLVFYEIMDDNTTSTAQYFYCNSSYTTGNILASDYCSLFYTQTTSDQFHLHKGNSWHRIIPMGINTTSGTINGVGVTSTSYILKRGSATSERYYYLNQDTSSFWKSTSLGVNWNSDTRTVNAHIHQIVSGSGYNYSVCAADNLSNYGCSSIQTEIIDFPILPPVPVLIYNPQENVDYNNTLYVNWSQSYSLTGQSITNYTLYYKRNTTSTWTLLDTVEYPTVEYTWDISNLANGGYDFKILVTDNLNYQSITVTKNFRITNALTLDTQLLTSIDTELDNIYEVLNMIPIIMLYLGLMSIGFWMAINYNFILGGLLLGSSLVFDLYLAVSYYSTAWYLTTIFIAIALFKPIGIWFMRSQKNRQIYI